jgi:hypothetical protein
VDAQDHVSSGVLERPRKPESTISPSAPISLQNEEGPEGGMLDLEDFDRDALLSGITDEEFC